MSQAFDQYDFDQPLFGGTSVGATDAAADAFFGPESDSMAAAGGYEPEPAGGGLQVTVVDSDQDVSDYLSELLDNAVMQAPTLSDLERSMPSSSMVVVLGPSCVSGNDFSIVERWNRTYPNVASILVTPDLSTEILQQALRAGVRDVLSAPISRDQLQDAVVRLAQTLPLSQHSAESYDSTALAPMPPPPAVAPMAAPPPPSAPMAPPSESPMAAPALAPMAPTGSPMLENSGSGRLISVFSTKGGSGKSVTATNLAVAMARRSSRPVVLLDGHLQFGDVAVMLKLHPANTVADAVGELDTLDAGMLERMLTVHEPSGLLVLPAPLEPTFVDRVSADELMRLIDVLRSVAGTVVVDLPSIFNDFVLSVLEASEEIILVAGLDLPNIKNVKIGMSTLQMLDVPKERLHLVLNRADSKVKLNVSEVERTLGVNAASHVPSDVVVPISVNKGAPVVLSAPKSGVARAFEELATRFLNENQASTAGAASGKRKLFG